MAPMASQGMYQDEGTVLSKILGIPIPGSLRMRDILTKILIDITEYDTGIPQDS